MDVDEDHNIPPEIPDTQPTDNNHEAGEELENESAGMPADVYGTLVFVGSSKDYPFPTQYSLRKEVTTIGKCVQADGDSPVDLGVKSAFELKHYRLMKHVSRVHFKLIRETRPDGGSHTVIEERSSNGTFVNGMKMAAKKQLLKHNSNIGLASNDLVFTYYENQEQNIGSDKLTERYIITSHKLGKGAFGEVFMGQEKHGRRNNIAVKRIAKTKFNSRGLAGATDQTALQREVGILREVNHPCCLCILDVDETPRDLYLVTEYCAGGELFDAITHERYNGKGVGEKLSKFYMYQIISALKYLHEKNICHRDMKPENVLLKEKDMEYTLLKLCDFGMAKMVNDDTMLKTCVGTPAYMPPEIISLNMVKRVQCYSFNCDIWSVGVIAFISLCGFPPFSEDYGDMSMEQQIMRCFVEPRMRIANWGDVGKTAKAFVLGMLCKLEKRMTSEQALEHEWFTTDTSDAVKEARLVMNAGTRYDPPESQDAQRSVVRKRPQPSTADSGTMDVDDHLSPAKRCLQAL